MPATYQFEQGDRIVAAREAVVDEAHIRKAWDWVQVERGRKVRVLDWDSGRAWAICWGESLDRYTR